MGLVYLPTFINVGKYTSPMDGLSTFTIKGDQSYFFKAEIEHPEHLSGGVRRSDRICWGKHLQVNW